MSTTAVVFYMLAAFILITGFLAVTARKIFRAAIWLLFSLIGIAGLYFLLQMEFIAAVQIVVYVGGIVILIIFSIFLTQQSGKELPSPLRPRVIVSLVSVLVGFIFSWLLISRHPFLIPTKPPLQSNIAAIGEQLLSTQSGGYVLPFELASMLLLAAMVGCIVIAIKTKSENK